MKKVYLWEEKTNFVFWQGNKLQKYFVIQTQQEYPYEINITQTRLTLSWFCFSVS